MHSVSFSIAIIVCAILVARSGATPFLASTKFQSFKALAKTATDDDANNSNNDNKHMRRLAVFARGGDQSDDDVEVMEDDVNDSDVDEPASSSSATAPFNFPFFQPNDGSATDPDQIPDRYLRMQKGDREKALLAMKDSLEWRAQHNVDTILSRPHTKFLQCKAVLPHGFVGRDSSNHIIFGQRPGMLRLDVAHKNSVSMDDLLFHYVYVLEYCWNVVEESKCSSTMTSLLDMRGMKLSLLRQSELVSFAKQFVSMMSKNYPQRSHKTFLLNAPRWFGTLYKLFKPLLRESTKAKIQIFSVSQVEEQKAALLELLGEDGAAAWERWTRDTDGNNDGENKNNNNDKSPSERLREDVLSLSSIEQGLFEFCQARLEESSLSMEELVATA